MSKEAWIQHMEASHGGTVRPSRGGSVEGWKQLRDLHLATGCPDCAARIKTLRANRHSRERHEALTSIGLKRVKGNLGGTYYE